MNRTDDSYSIHESTCALCNARSNDRNFKIPVLQFKFLQNEPAVCELCVAKKLGLNTKWDSQIQKLITTEDSTNV